MATKPKKRALVYEEWINPVMQFVQDKSERCDVWEYLHAYQFAKNFDKELPPLPEGEKARFAIAFLQSRLDDVCESYKNIRERNAENGSRSSGRIEKERVTQKEKERAEGKGKRADAQTTRQTTPQWGENTPNGGEIPPVGTLRTRDITQNTYNETHITDNKKTDNVHDNEDDADAESVADATAQPPSVVVDAAGDVECENVVGGAGVSETPPPVWRGGGTAEPESVEAEEIKQQRKPTEQEEEMNMSVFAAYELLRLGYVFQENQVSQFLTVCNKYAAEGDPIGNPKAFLNKFRFNGQPSIPPERGCMAAQFLEVIECADLVVLCGVADFVNNNGAATVVVRSSDVARRISELVKPKQNQVAKQCRMRSLNFTTASGATPYEGIHAKIGRHGEKRIDISYIARSIAAGAEYGRQNRGK